jgi:hypothetical protein
MFRSVRLLHFLFAMPALCMLAAPARADHEHVTVAQASNGHIIATISGDFLPCAAFGFVGSPVLVGNPIPPPFVFVDSTVLFSTAPCPSPPPLTPIPYSTSVDLGPALNGTTPDVWRFSGDITASFPFTYTVAGGVLVGGPLLPAEPVPALGDAELALLCLLLALSGMWRVLRSRRHSSRTT